MSNYPRLCGVNYESFVDGEGMRATFFFAGCPHHCPGCHNPETWNPDGGVEITEDMMHEFAREIKKRPFLKGITLSGGDPFMDPKKTLLFLAKLCDLLGTAAVNVWCYTGYTLQEIISGKNRFWSRLLLLSIDVLVDGKFDQSKADRRLTFCGSSNQRIIDISESLVHGEVRLWKGAEDHA